MHFFPDFSKNMKNKKSKIKNGSKRWNLGFWGAESSKNNLNIFFWLGTTNNDQKQKDES